MLTIGESDRQAAAYIQQGDYQNALRTYVHLIRTVPTHLDARLRVADTLLAMQHFQEAATVYLAFARNTSKLGYPLRALVALKVLSTLEPKLSVLLDEIAELYHVDSPWIGQGARLSLPHREQPLTDDDALTRVDVQQAVTLACTFDSSAIPFPEKLSGIPFLSSLPKTALIEVIRMLLVRREQPGAYVFEQGDAGSSFFMPARGSVAVKQDKSAQPLVVLHENTIFGELALLSNSPRNASVVTETECDLIEFPRDSLIMAGPTTAHALEHFAQERLIRHLLRTAPLFSSLTYKQREDLLKYFEPRHVESGCEVITQDGEVPGLYIIFSGEVEVVREDSENKLTLAILGVGDIIGEIALLNSQRASATVIARQPVGLLFLDASYVHRLLEAFPKIRGYVEELGSERLLATHRRIHQSASDEEIEVDLTVLV